MIINCIYPYSIYTYNFYFRQVPSIKEFWFTFLFFTEWEHKMDFTWFSIGCSLSTKIHPPKFLPRKFLPRKFLPRNFSMEDIFLFSRIYFFIGSLSLISRITKFVIVKNHIIMLLTIYFTINSSNWNAVCFKMTAEISFFTFFQIKLLRVIVTLCITSCQKWKIENHHNLPQFNTI